MATFYIVIYTISFSFKILDQIKDMIQKQFMLSCVVPKLQQYSENWSTK